MPKPRCHFIKKNKNTITAALLPMKFWAELGWDKYKCWTQSAETNYSWLSLSSMVCWNKYFEKRRWTLCIVSQSRLQHYGQILTMSLSFRIKMTIPCISAPIFTIIAASALQIHRFSGCLNNWFSWWFIYPKALAFLGIFMWWNHVPVT